MSPRVEAWFPKVGAGFMGDGMRNDGKSLGRPIGCVKHFDSVRYHDGVTVRGSWCSTGIMFMETDASGPIPGGDGGINRQADPE